ncbi:MAG: glycoside hydrolase family 3 C-terminal domain-containing protein [Tractidigestivibacter sp.]|jgi:beta-glucosidase|uniref:glycoside hydrolase family 3 C-terminal domain-containing protein n=1 Tax=Tractidigestivibacter sp. TaxID=2847320 RepID=UPI003D93013E
MKHEDIISKMTLEEKCALLQGATTFGSWGSKRLGIPEMSFSDGPNGMRHQAGAADHLGINPAEPATCLPTAVTVANSWDEKMAEKLGEVLGNEARVQGVGTVLGPGLCIKRSPLCGRNFEYFSEDPYLAGKMAAAYVRGIQSNGVAACPKHFAVNSQETRRQASDSVIDERTMREIYLTGFETVVKEAAPKAIMSSYNQVNGTYANENEHLLKDILRDEWGFDGAVVTDWGGSNDHVAGVRAGSDFEMPAPGMDSACILRDAVKAGKLSEEDLNACVDDALELVLSTHRAVESAPKEFDVEGHHAIARAAAAEGAVLLKNENNALPLAKGTKVALIGDFAKEPRYQGAGSSQVNCTKVDSVLGLIGQTDLTLVGYEPGFERHGGENASKRDAALDLARRADVVLMCLALDEIAESEGADRQNMRLNQNQVELLHAVAGVNPNVVVLLAAGSCVETDWVVDARAVLYLALGGQAGAGAALDIVTGAVNPSGKLTETWPRALDDTPTAGRFPSQERTAEYREGIYVGYRYYQTAGVKVAYPFGYGLSYTTFEYANPRANEEGVSFTLTNTGEVTGTEVCQLYVALPNHKVFRPAQELKGFARVELQPGESREVTIGFDDKTFRYFNVKTASWEVEGGTYELRVGASSEDIRLKTAIKVAGTGAPNPYEGETLASYETGHVQHVSDKQFEALLGHPIPPTATKIDRNMCFRDLNHGRSPIFWIVWCVLAAIKRSSDASGTPNLNVLFIWNMPLRALAKMTNGMVSMGMVDALVREIKWWGLVGIIPSAAIKYATGEGFILTWFLWFLAPILIEFIINLVRSNGMSSKLKEA